MDEYVVVYAFRDLEDTGKTFPDGRVYDEVGAPFPATKRTVTTERLEELSSSNNKIGRPLIKKVENGDK